MPAVKAKLSSTAKPHSRTSSDAKSVARTVVQIVGSKKGVAKSRFEVVPEPEDAALGNPIAKTQFPTDLISRSRFRLASGKVVTPHQWKVYDFIMSCPPGKVTTYGLISKALNSSPQAVGGALRDNPWAPEVPCHRVITTNSFIGGYQGDWGNFDKSKEVKDEGGKELRGGSKRIERKLTLLEGEGVIFDGKGTLIVKSGEDLFYRG